MQNEELDHGLNSRYVIVRSDNDVLHVGTLLQAVGTSCVLTNAQKLLYWKPLRGSGMSAVARSGLHQSSEISDPSDRVLLTRVHEIIGCTGPAERFIADIDPMG